MLALAGVASVLIGGQAVDMGRFLAQHDMVWEKAPQRWLDGVPLANGDIGVVVWGDGRPLKLTLDKYDAWETREARVDPAKVNYAKLREWVAAGDAQRAEQCLRTQTMYAGGKPHPTRLPMPRLEIDLGEEFTWEMGRLGLHDAVASISGSAAGGPLDIQTFVDAEKNLVVVRLRGKGAGRARVRLTLDHLDAGAKSTLKAWGYPEPEITTSDSAGSLRLKAPSGFQHAAVWRRTRDEAGDAHTIRVALLSSNDVDDPLAAAGQLAAEAEKEGGAMDGHRRWWAEYWKRSFLTIPDARLEALYYIEMYKLGCSSRPGKLPITLQGLWTLDGGMPPWAGDYHLDMNVQQSYWPIYTANRLELGEPLYETFFKCLPRWGKQCKEFFGFEGAWSGCAIGPRGERVFGYSTVEMWPGNAAWLAHHYWLHFLYSQDKGFLKARALPMLRACFLTYAGLLEEGEDGRLHIPLSYSPEWGEGSMAGYGRDPTCDIALIRFLAKALLRGAEVLGEAEPLAERARHVLAKLADFPQSNHRLLVRAGVPLSHSHRHHSHLMAIYPLEELTIEDGGQAAALLRNSIHDIRVQGFGQWTGWAFPWMSLIASRAGYPNMAFEMLDMYVNAFITPNTFHINGDPKAYGVSMFTYEPMTLEAGFGAAAAIMEMLLQSWHGTIRVFAATPAFWHDAYFADLQAQGAFVVTAKRAEGRTRFVRIASEAGGECRVKNPFGGQAARLAEIDPANPEAETPGKPRTLTGDTLTFATVKGWVYLLYPQEPSPSAEELAPVVFERPASDVNYFGVKKLPRF